MIVGYLISVRQWPIAKRRPSLRIQFMPLIAQLETTWHDLFMLYYVLDEFLDILGHLCLFRYSLRGNEVGSFP